MDRIRPWILLLLLCEGCSGFKHYAINQQPVVKSSQDKNEHFGYHKTFTLVRYSSLANDGLLQGTQEDALLFCLLNAIEQRRNYRYVNEFDSADIVFTIKMTDEYNPDSTLNPLVVTPELTTKETFDLKKTSFGTKREFPRWPLPDANSTKVYFPLLRMTVFNRKTKLPVFQSVAGTVTNIPDPIISGQYSIVGLVDEYPVRTLSGWWSDNFGSGQAGCFFGIFTPDGENFWPEILSVVKDAPMDEAGLYPGVFILDIDGISMKNREGLDVNAAIRGDVGEKHKLRTWYAGKLHSHEITMAPRYKSVN